LNITRGTGTRWTSEAGDSELQERKSTNYNLFQIGAGFTKAAFHKIPKDIEDGLDDLIKLLEEV
jgi:hypothetical protein